MIIQICDLSFKQKNYEGVITQYTKAIELSRDRPNHIYFAKRADAYFEMGLFEECIADCNEAINIDPSYINSYKRKREALIELRILPGAVARFKDGSLTEEVIIKKIDKEDSKRQIY